MNDFMAGGTYDRLEELGLHAGKDIAVAGYDNREMACYEKPPLTTMALPLHDIGYKACQIIIGILKKEEVKLDKGNCYVECIPCIPGVGEPGEINILVTRFCISMEWGLLLE